MKWWEMEEAWCEFRRDWSEEKEMTRSLAQTGELGDRRAVVRHSRKSALRRREGRGPPSYRESTGEGFALGGRWDNSPTRAGRMKENDHCG